MPSFPRLSPNKRLGDISERQTNIRGRGPRGMKRLSRLGLAWTAILQGWIAVFLRVTSYDKETLLGFREKRD